MSIKLRNKDFMKILKNFIFYILVFCNLNLFAEWNPEYCIPQDKSKMHRFSLKSDNYRSLKATIIRYLKGSWCTSEKAQLLMDLMVIIRPTICVEIGTFNGSSALPVASVLKFLKSGKLYTIDAWSNQIAIKNMSADDPNRLWWSRVDMDEVFSVFQKMIKTWQLSKNCFAIKKSSQAAASLIANNSVDFLHLDGDYTEEGSLQDVELYLPKVKSGGYILLSNFSICINGFQPKIKSYSLLYDTCEMICDIENENAFLFRKI